MRRLVPQQAVTLELDAVDEGPVEALRCLVGGVQGPVATLASLDEVQPDVAERLTTGLFGFMLFTHNGSPIGLRGVIRSAPHNRELVEFVVIDGIQVAERRTAERIAMIAPVRATATDVGTEVQTVTANLSLGGALLTRRPGLGEGPQWKLQVSLPGDPNPVRFDATTARITPTHIGVRFDDVDEADRIRLAGALADHQRRRSAIQATTGAPSL
jgi:hypothetical protein